MLAIIPAAGLGTRMSSVTDGRPKELLPVGGFTVLHRIVNEALDAGADRVRVVGSPAKPAVKELVLDIGDPRVEYAEQEAPQGLADAIRSGAEPGQPALALMGDTIYEDCSTLATLITKIAEGAWAGVAVHEVPLEEVSNYGVVGFDPEGRVDRIVEKPDPFDAPSRFAIASRFALSGEASSALFEMLSRKAVEGLNLTDVLAEGLLGGRRIEAIFLPEGARMYDCGQPDGYRAAVEAYG